MLKLFLELCRAHGLTWKERFLMWRLARCQRLRDPARLFLEADRFEEARLSRPLKVHNQSFRAIRARLFRAPPIVEADTETLPGLGPDGGPNAATEAPDIAKPTTGGPGGAMLPETVVRTPLGQPPDPGTSTANAPTPPG